MRSLKRFWTWALRGRAGLRRIAEWRRQKGILAELMAAAEKRRLVKAAEHRRLVWEALDKINAEARRRPRPGDIECVDLRISGTPTLRNIPEPSLPSHRMTQRVA